MRHNLPSAQFHALVDIALGDLPDEFQEAMTNIAILVQSWPTQQDLTSADVPPGQTLMGLYHGIPLTQRSRGYQLVPPDTITLYQGPIEASCQTVQEIPEQVRHVIIHEIAHHFGISDDRLRELGAY